MTKSVAVCLFVLMSAACADAGPARVETPADPAAGEVAFEMAGPGDAVLIVPVHINGAGPFQFVLDTGATLTCLDQDVSAQLGLPAVKGVIGTGAGVGGQGRLALVEIDSLQIGAVSAHELQACVIDLQHLDAMGIELDGLLGLNVLKEFRVTLDFTRGIVRFDAPADTAPE